MPLRTDSAFRERTMDDQLTHTTRFVHAPPARARSNGLAVAGFVFALWGALSSFIPIVNLAGDLLAFLGLGLSAISLVRSGRRGTGRSLPVAAIILGLFAFVISIVVNIAATGSVSAFSTGAEAMSLAHTSMTAAAPAHPGVTSSGAV
jgi:hypothetical protein